MKIDVMPPGLDLKIGFDDTLTLDEKIAKLREIQAANRKMKAAIKGLTVLLQSSER
ncbi:MAG TPA: hypothetical protein VHR84_01705 [Terriglobales bacterium]|jgi:hypothetical protein|nr:hypothetical protein [Terriglobales bacterium]